MFKKKIISYCYRVCLGAMILSAPLASEEGEESDSTHHVPVGERACSHSEKVQIQETRALMCKKIESGELFTSEEFSDLSEAEKEEALSCNGISEEKEEARKKTPRSPVTAYYTTHNGAFHNPFYVSLLGDAVGLEDGSVWAVSSSHRYKTLDWLTCDLIIVTPNHDWFSSYDYKLINVNTGAAVNVNLSLGPIYNGLYTHWILAIDYANREICLEDGSIWKMSCLEGSTVSKWLPNDTVIIGINDGWFSGSNPNILINVNVNNYAMGSCIY